MGSVFLNRLKDETSSDIIYRLRIEWLSDSFNLTIVSPDSAYYSHMTNEQILSQNKLRGYSDEKYFNECKKALVSNLATNEFEYRLDNESFVIKKKLEKNMKIIFITFQLEKIDFGKAAQLIFDGAIQQIADLSSKFDLLQNDNESLRQAWKEKEEVLSELNNEKDVLEKVMYSRFSNVLNSKKQKITELMNLSPIKVENRNEEENAELRRSDLMHDDSIFDKDTDDDA